MKIIKRILLVVSVLLVIGIGSLAAMINLIDPNEYKPELASLIEESTGRTLDFPGELDISFYPWFGFSTGELSIDNAPGFGDEPMLTIASANVQIKLLPLLEEQLEIGQVVLNQPSIRFHTRADGSSNLDDILGTQDLGKTDSATQASIALAGLAIQGISVTNGKVVLVDETQDMELLISGLELQTGAITPGVPAEVALALEAAGNTLSAPVSLNATTTLTINEDFSLLLLDSLAAKIQTGQTESNLSVAGAEIGLANGALGINGLEFTQPGSRIFGDLIFTDLASDPAMEGSIDASIDDVAAFMQANGLNVVTGETLGGSVAINSRFKYSDESIEINTVTLETTLPGSETSLSIPFAGLNLSTGDLSIPNFELRQQGLNVSGSTSGAGVLSNFEQARLWGDLDLNVDNVESVLAQNGIQEALPQGLLNQFSMASAFTLLAGHLELNSMRGAMDDASFEGAILLKNLVSDSPMILAVRQDLKEINLKQVLTALEISSNVEGKGNVSLDLDNLQIESEAPANAASGMMDFRVYDGAITGFDLQSMLQNIALLLKASGSGIETTSYSADDRTRFTELTGTFRGENGRFESNNIAMKAPAIRMQGVGGFDLPANLVDFDFGVAIVNTTEGQGGGELQDLAGTEIPLKVEGPLDSPRYGLDYQKLLATQAGNQAKQAVEDKVNEAVQELGGKLKLNFGFGD